MDTPKGLLVILCIFCWVTTSASAGDLVVPVPVPNGTDDTDAIQTALNVCVAHGAGCTVQLAAGTYLTRQLFAEDFHGTFRGQGMDVTILQALPNLEVNQDQPVWKNPPSLSNKYPMLILFFGGNITVSDMTIEALATNPTQGWHDYQGHVEPVTWHQDPNTWLWSVLEFMGQSDMNVIVTRVALHGAYDRSVPGLDNYNAAGLSIDPYPPIDSPTPGYVAGMFRISACRIDTFAEGIYGAALHNARLTIGGSPSAANLIRNCGYDALLIDLDSSSVDFSYNDAASVGPTAWGAFMVLQRWMVPIAAPSSFLVQHNRITATGGSEEMPADGIWVADCAPWYGEGRTGDFVISHNDVTLDDSLGMIAGDGIETYQTAGAVISNNRVVGRGWTGIALWGDAGAMVKANNVENVTAEAELYPAPLCLMEGTTDCTVVGFGSKANVYDEGVGNTLVGVKSVQRHPPGPAIRDAMKRKMEMLKSIRRP